jgi:hypothetical protein
MLAQRLLLSILEVGAAVEAAVRQRRKLLPAESLGIGGNPRVVGECLAAVVARTAAGRMKR